MRVTARPGDGDGADRAPVGLAVEEVVGGEDDRGLDPAIEVGEFVGGDALAVDSDYPEALDLLIEAGLDAMNVDVKGNVEAVKRYCATDVEKVWRNCWAALRKSMPGPTRWVPSPRCACLPSAWLS